MNQGGWIPDMGERCQKEAIMLDSGSSQGWRIRESRPGVDGFEVIAHQEKEPLASLDPDLNLLSTQRPSPPHHYYVPHRATAGIGISPG